MISVTQSATKIGKVVLYTAQTEDGTVPVNLLSSIRRVSGNERWRVTLVSLPKSGTSDGAKIKILLSSVNAAKEEGTFPVRSFALR